MSGWPVFPAPLVKEIVFSPLCILACFVKDKMSIGVWIYLWAFYFVPLIYISVFVPVPYCLDDCGFVVSFPVHQAPLSLGFSRQEHWSGLPFPSPMHESGKWKVESESEWVLCCVKCLFFSYWNCHMNFCFYFGNC